MASQVHSSSGYMQALKGVVDRPCESNNCNRLKDCSFLFLSTFFFNVPLHYSFRPFGEKNASSNKSLCIPSSPSYSLSLHSSPHCIPSFLRPSEVLVDPAVSKQLADTKVCMHKNKYYLWRLMNPLSICLPYRTRTLVPLSFSLLSSLSFLSSIPLICVMSLFLLSRLLGKCRPLPHSIKWPMTSPIARSTATTTWYARPSFKPYRHSWSPTSSFGKQWRGESREGRWRNKRVVQWDEFIYIWLKNLRTFPFLFFVVQL